MNDIGKLDINTFTVPAKSDIHCIVNPLLNTTYPLVVKLIADIPPADILSSHSIINWDVDFEYGVRKLAVFAPE